MIIIPQKSITLPDSRY